MRTRRYRGQRNIVCKLNPELATARSHSLWCRLYFSRSVNNATDCQTGESALESTQEEAM